MTGREGAGDGHRAGHGAVRGHLSSRLRLRASIGAHPSEGSNVASDWWYRETQPGSPITEPNIVAVFPRLGPEGLGSGGLPVPDPDVTRIIIEVHQAAVAHLRDRHPHLEVGWGVSVQDYQAEPGAEADTEAYCEPRDQVFVRASAGDDYIGVQTYTRGRIGPGGDPIEDPAVPRTLTGWEYYPPALGGAVRRR